MYQKILSVIFGLLDLSKFFFKNKQRVVVHFGWGSYIFAGVPNYLKLRALVLPCKGRYDHLWEVPRGSIVYINHETAAVALIGWMSASREAFGSTLVDCAPWKSKMN